MNYSSIEKLLLPPAYGGCTCSCHNVPYIYHCVPCCYITDELEKRVLERINDGQNPIEVDVNQIDKYPLTNETPVIPVTYDTTKESFSGSIQTLPPNCE